jgi:acetate CoA/acetoacetate CoA-transferase alpha subunit
MRNKIVSVQEAVSHINDGCSIMIGGFLGCGTSEIMMDAIVEKGVKDLTIIGNDTGFETIGAGKLVTSKQVSHIIATHVGTNKQTGIQMASGETKVTLVPQGTLVEQIRAAGMGLGGVLTPTGLGTMVADGKDVITVDGKEYLLEKPVKADVAILKGTIVDKAGNVYFEGTTKNFQQMMAMAADTVIVEAEKLVEVGELDPNMVMTPAIFVDYIVVGGDK